MPLFPSGHVKAYAALAVALAATCAGLVLAPASAATNAQLGHDARIDYVGQQLSGYPDMQVLGDDDASDWGQLLGILGVTNPAENTLGFVTIYAPPDAATYHRIYMSPTEWPALVQAANGDWSNVQSEAVAIFDLSHEATHYRLFSSDEGRVNACALQAFPAVIQDYFAVPAVVSEPSQVEHDVAVYRTVKRVVYVRFHGKRVRRVRMVRVRSGTRVTTTNDGPPVSVPNPTYATLVAAAQAFYASQPPPYSTGSCF